VNCLDNKQVPGSCAGCGREIVCRYFLRAVGQSWHVGGCLRCVSCLASLDSQRSCFVRSGLIYCRADYCRSAAPQVPHVSVSCPPPPDEFLFVAGSMGSVSLFLLYRSVQKVGYRLINRIKTCKYRSGFSSTS